MKRIAVEKFKLQRAYGWFSMFGVPFLVADALQRRLHISFVWLVVAAMVLLFVMGWADKTFFYKHEAGYQLDNMIAGKNKETKL